MQVYGTIISCQIHQIKEECVRLLEKISKFGTLSERTKTSYKEWINPFLTFCCERSMVIEAKETGEEYICELVAKHRDLTYVNNIKRILEKLFGYKLQQVTSRELSDDIRSNEELILQDDRVLTIINWAEANIETYFEISFFILLMYYTAARPNEVKNLTGKNIRDLLNRGETRIIGKGGRPRYILSASTPIHTEVYQTALRRADCRDDQPMLKYTLRHLRRKFKELQERVLKFSWPYPAPHSLRRASGRAIYPTSDMFVTMERLGHKSMTTTQSYLRCNRETVKLKLNLIEQERYNNK